MAPTPLQSALQVAPERSSAATVRAERELFCFRAGGIAFAFGAQNVREVIRLSPLTPLPRVPSFVLGVCGHRGEVLPVIDLLRYLQKGEMKPGERTRLLVGISEAFVAAFPADSVAGLMRVQVEDILPPPVASDAAAEHLEGIVTTPGSHGALHVLNLPALLQTIHQRVVAR